MKNYPFKQHKCSILLSNFYCSIMSEFSLSFSRNSRQYTVSKLVFHSILNTAHVMQNIINVFFHIVCLLGPSAGQVTKISPVPARH